MVSTRLCVEDIEDMGFESDNRNMAWHSHIASYCHIMTHDDRDVTCARPDTS